MTVYLLHFDQPISADHTAQHYIGYAVDRNLNARLAHHKAGTGARICAVALSRGIDWQVARTWPKESREFERKLKRRKAGKKLCPICQTTLQSSGSLPSSS